MISIVIPCKDDQIPLNRTVASILSSVKEKVEIVVCDDGSKVPIEHPECKIVRHSNTIGVGAAIDTAVKNSNGDTLIISGADMYYADNGWLEKGIRLLDLDRNTVWSTGCSGYNELTGCLNKNVRYGCKMIIKADKSDVMLSRRHAFPDGWRMLFRSKWYSKSEVKENQEVPSLLGACYFIDKLWYFNIGGFKLHRYWGTLDSMLAMKSWMAGGKCRVATDIITYHSFSRSVSGKPMDWFIYNKIMNVRTIFPEKEEELLDWIKDDPNYNSGLNIANSNPLNKEIEKQRDYLQFMFTRDYDWYVDRFNLK